MTKWPEMMAEVDRRNHISDKDYNDQKLPKVCTLSQKTKDFIGENLIDIEKTLEALHEDFIQAVDGIRKINPTEIPSRDAKVSPRMAVRAKLPRTPTNHSSIEVSPKSTKSSLDKQSSQQSCDGGMQYLNDSGSIDRMLTDGKRSTTPDTGFASRETTSRRDSQKSTYSPQDDVYTPYALPKVNGSFPSRQRSMSFTDNYTLKSPVLSEPQTDRIHRSTVVERANSIESQTVRRRAQTDAQHPKSKSRRGRNKRRETYRPALHSSSSSDDEDSSVYRIDKMRPRNQRHSYTDRHSTVGYANGSQYDAFQFHSSETDIRPKTRRSAKARSMIQPSPLYGSNASIQSAPQYNNFAMRSLEDGRYPRRSDDEECMPQEMSYFQQREQLERRPSFHLRRQMPNPIVNRQIIEAAFTTYTRFDVSKLTGISPTTESCLADGSKPAQLHQNYEQPLRRMQPPIPLQQLVQAQSIQVPYKKMGKKLPQTPQKRLSAGSVQYGANSFQWPEQIHVSAIAAQNASLPWTSTSAGTIKNSPMHPVNAYK